MMYIRTADRLTRTAPWVESFEGGVEKLRRIILQDELDICADLDAEMDALIGTYQDEWKRAVQDPELRKIPVVVLTTSGADEDVARSYDLHANVFVTKPVDFDHFTEVVRQIDDFFISVAKLPSADN